MHQSDASKLMNLGKVEWRSENKEDFFADMQMIHEQVKEKIQDKIQRYK
jgi:hypothetical protein